jgi:hypothetical protein
MNFLWYLSKSNVSPRSRSADDEQLPSSVFICPAAFLLITSSGDGED